MKILGLIFGISFLVEILALIAGAPLGKSLGRMILFSGLFAWLLSGSRFARYMLGILYLLSTLLAGWSAIRSDGTIASIMLLGGFAIYSLVAGLYFLRSKVLRALTSRAPAMTN
ncbi:hypothetical protein [Herbaspirillum sp. CAH-3]|uniref:hypothetical protein n=1 Tax=Herbaspirillum sp. CAH-3 TaxID=2605746 RepID=UPI0012AC9BAF|nr:hypothetical protein [Herbaspirillum sp. CAH-3]MRT29761.1 hypothetical protein [Herbaspirillum sp. CAH-3]